ncbi:putative ATP-binding protein [Acanthamoeba castellanii mimivirus]|jgi:hypothetical protein|uniref:Uncharacterized protein L611 n=5 Tax=Mimivirus TaxID=315393 RepID=YL611_MIMIV|nr:putative ATP-binding [Acanthamoeba polyphaga mimivirus]Q5UP76.1 RecName: Full=Uncharacterized protein L611 [Acanthamoeba polyphaga mimivirus]ALR84199.1 putative ATP-binding protein [Niemeyer virus]AMK61969.1 P-loop ATPase/GTPase [Samba virus]AMZ03054.1 putative ATP-binding [Mimivirus Bombay]BAV61727.1 putative ATP-binding protein [Acanthamoeba castellanii mimivirus]AAV50873.1 unknown [Acanthamoeba polyphaga mimivirus]
MEQTNETVQDVQDVQVAGVNEANQVTQNVEPSLISLEKSIFATHSVGRVGILLIDASNSVTFNKINDKIVFDKMVEIVKNLPESEFRCIFWNSDNNRFIDSKSSKFKNGVQVFPSVFKKETINQIFTIVKSSIDEHCLTWPHLSFNAIPDSWINNTDPINIYFITDGEMGHRNIGVEEMMSLKMNLKNSIQKIFDKFNSIRLNIITLEPIVRDFTQMESLRSAAGCDVYNVIMENQMTRYITKFTSYTPDNTNGFVHISRNIPPPGYVPFGDKYFSEIHKNEFVKYILRLVKSTSNEDDLLKIVQNLSTTVSVLTKDKPPQTIRQTVKIFSDLFQKSTLDITLVNYLLEEAVEKETSGSANIFAAYKTKLKDLYKQADELLQTNVSKAIGVNETFLSVLVGNKIISGHARMIDQDTKINGKMWKNSCIDINGVRLPVLPFDTSNQSHMNEQCLRQWMRLLVTRLYNVNTMDDMAIYSVLMMMVRVVASDIDDNVKQAYRKLATIMLKKKRANSDTTELDRLEDGQLPIPNNGKIESFYSYMTKVSANLNLHVSSMTQWYIICLALNNDKLILRQLIHCKDHIEKDFPGIKPSELFDLVKKQIEPVNFVKIPVEYSLDYQCLVTLEDVSNKGGFKFLPHNSLTGDICRPIYVLSEEGQAGLIADPNTSICPICYAQLTHKDFEKVGPKVQQEELNVFTDSSEYKNLFGLNQSIQTITSSASPVISTFTTTANPSTQGFPGFDGRNVVLNKKGTLVIMKGTVGAGKSSISLLIKQEVENNGGHCFVEGTDKYCKTGLSTVEAIQEIKLSLSKINLITDDKPIVVVIDTCGERNNGDVAFDVKFTGWNKINVFVNHIRSEMNGYLAWTLRNVLRRTKPTDSDNHFLNPESAGLKVCMDVHRNKATALFGKKIPVLFSSTPNSINEAIEKLNEAADAYQAIIDQQKPLTDQVKLVIDKIF